MPIQFKVIVVASLLLITGVLVAIGWLPAPDGYHNLVGGTTSAVEAVELVNSTLTKVQGFPWFPIEAVGFGAPRSISMPAGMLTGFFPNCTSIFRSGMPLSLPANPPEAFPGDFPNWEIVSVDTLGGIALSFVTSTQIPVVSIAVIEGPGCAANYSPIVNLPSTFLDSPVIGELAEKDGGSQFRGTHAGVAEEMVLANGSWAVVYTTCSPYSGDGVGDQFLAGFSAVTGVAAGIQPDETGVSCSINTFAPRLGSSGPQ
jgi:hypothetical protein